MTQKQSKRELILDVAERLFALKKFHGVSVRDITNEANVRLASVNYYFETKENLYLEILARRAIPIVAERKALLAAINFEELDRADSVRAVTLAIIDPLYEKLRTRDPGWRAYTTIIADYAVRQIGDQESAPPMSAIDEESLEFIRALNQLSASDDDAAAHHVFQFITLSMLVCFANNGRLNTLSQNAYHSDNYEAIYEYAVEFIVGGALASLGLS